MINIDIETAIQITITVIAACGPGYLLYLGRRIMRDYGEVN